MLVEVVLTASSQRDLSDIVEFIASRDSPEAADYVAVRLQSTIHSLSKFPNRGAFPKELHALGNQRVREIFFKPNRIFYVVVQATVVIVLIGDGRRELDTLLMHRMLEI